LLKLYNKRTKPVNTVFGAFWGGPSAPDLGINSIAFPNLPIQLDARYPSRYRSNSFSGVIIGVVFLAELNRFVSHRSFFPARPVPFRLF
jgi:hypothetical protein